MDFTGEKSALRRKFSALRKSIDCETRQQYDAAICAAICELECFKEAEYIATRLKDYEAKLAYWQSMLGSPVADTIAGVIARTVPCECREAQCSVFCPRYGMENCCENDL